MDQIMNVFNTIVRDWWLVVLVFTAGGAWIQGRAWVDKFINGVQDMRADIEELKTHTAGIQAISADLRGGRAEMNAIVADQRRIFAELERNSQEHSAIVRELEKHVTSNAESDVSVRQSLAVIADRLGRK